MSSLFECHHLMTFIYSLYILLKGINTLGDFALSFAKQIFVTSCLLSYTLSHF